MMKSLSIWSKEKFKKPKRKRRAGFCKVSQEPKFRRCLSRKLVSCRINSSYWRWSKALPLQEWRIISFKSINHSMGKSWKTSRRRRIKSTSCTWKESRRRSANSSSNMTPAIKLRPMWPLSSRRCSISDSSKRHQEDHQEFSLWVHQALEDQHNQSALPSNSDLSWSAAEAYSRIKYRKTQTMARSSKKPGTKVMRFLTTFWTPWLKEDWGKVTAESMVGFWTDSATINRR